MISAQTPGDATSDGVIDVLDVAAIVNQILGQGTSPGFADCTVDGSVDGADVDCVWDIILSQNSPTPAILSLSPSSAVVGSPDLMVTVSGSDFFEAAIGQFDGTDLATAYLNTTALRVTVPALLLEDAGSFPLRVIHPDGKASLAAYFTVHALPALDALTPSGVAAGSPDFTLTLSGEGFRPESVAVLDGTDLTTTFIGTGMLTAVVPAAQVAAPGSRSVLVRHPVAGNTDTLPLRVANLSFAGLSPTSGPVGTTVTLTGTGLDLPVTVLFAKQGGGTLPAPVVTSTPTSLTVQVPAGAATGNVRLVSGGLTLTGPTFTVTTSQTYDLTGGPASTTLLPGHNASYAITASSPDGFAGLIHLSISGLPTGVTADLQPQQITPGQTAILTLSAPAGQPPGVEPFTVTGNAEIEGQTVVRTVNLSVDVQPLSTTFMGRTVSADPVPIPLQGVTVSFLGLDDQGNPTGCAVPPVETDFAGNYVFNNLPLECTGVQLVGYDGLTVTNPPDQQFAGVNLRWTILPNEVTVASSLTHLIRIDSAETIEIAQNAAGTQFFTLETIPGLRIEVYPGTTFSLVTGEMPDPFELIAVRVPTDRLPDQKETPPGVVMPFFVAFQPAGAFASQPVAVDYPNVTALPAGTATSLFTLDPTQGMMVPYGTGTVSADGLSIVADEDPATPGRRYGITHFDWHGPLTPLVANAVLAWLGGEGGAVLTAQCAASGFRACISSSCPVTIGRGSVEYATGTEYLTAIDAAISGIVLPVVFERIYRSDFEDFEGPFGLGTSHSFNYTVLAGADPTEMVINVAFPNGRQLAFADQLDGTYLSSTNPFVRGSVLRWDDVANEYRLETIDGSVLIFAPPFGGNRSPLTGIEDRHGNRIELVRGLGSGNVEVLKQIVATNGETLTLQYDALNRIRKLTDPGGRDTLYAYDAEGRLETVTDPAGGETVFGYTPGGQLETITDARGIVVVTKEYGADGRVSRETFPDGGEVTYAYTLANPNDPESPVIETLITDALGNPTTYRFTVEGALTDVTDALGQTLFFEIDPVSGRYLARRGTAGCGGCGNTGIGDQTFEYDDLGRITKLTDALEKSTDFTYTPVGEVPEMVTDALMRLTVFNQNAVGDVTSIVDPAGMTWDFTYDGAGRLETMTDPNLNTTTFTYGANGRLESVTDPLLRVTSFEYDSVGRLTATILPDGTGERLAYDPLDRIISVEDGLGQLIRFTYDEVGNLRTVTDARGNSTEYVYEEAPQRLIREIAPDGNERIYIYDANGNQISFTDRNGHTATFDYDDLNRPVLASYQDGTMVEYEWDAAGRLVAADDGVGGRVERAYDEVGRLVTEVSPTGLLEYQYDAIGRRTFRFGPDGTTGYTYKLQGQLESVTNGGMSVTFDYDDGGRRVNAVAPNGVTLIYTYDDASQLTRIDYSNSSGFSAFRAYSYDLMSKVVTVSGDFLTPTLPTFQNTEFDELNRTTFFNGRAFSYDNEGRLLSDGNRTYAWNDQGRLSQTQGPEGSTSYQYDVLGRRTRTIEQASTTAYLNDLSDVARTIKDGIATDYLRGLSLDETWVESKGATVHTYLRDHLNSTIALADSAGIAGVFHYADYGASISDDGTVSPQFGYTGREHDQNGLIYLRARYYSPNAGRFLSEDPIGFAGLDVNLYRYVHNDPILFADPLGLRGDVAQDIALFSADLYLDIGHGFRYFGLVSGVLQRLTGDPFAPITLSEALTIAGVGATLAGLSGVGLTIAAVGAFQLGFDIGNALLEPRSSRPQVRVQDIRTINSCGRRLTITEQGKGFKRTRTFETIRITTPRCSPPCFNGQ